MRIFILCLFSIAYFPSSSLAIQLHGDPEGLFVHQIAHAFFAISMATLLYWLFRMKILFSRGWRFIGLGATFLILWNINAFIGHSIEGSDGVGMVVEGNKWAGIVKFYHLTDGMAILYYFAKLDHLLCVPAIVSLYLGLKELYSNNSSTSKG
ncbi:MAG: hypothetical protein N2260_06915 [Syntrophobacterales bacterium]|nr:hypothetical protein [Syntrophobacterales bacterium]